MTFYAESVSSCVRFAERLAEKLPTRPLAANEKIPPARRNPGEASRIYRMVHYLIKSGVSALEACSRHNVSESGYRAWRWRNGGRK